MKRYLAFSIILICASTAYAEQPAPNTCASMPPPLIGDMEALKKAQECEREYEKAHPPVFMAASSKPSNPVRLDVWNKCQTQARPDREYYEGTLLKKKIYNTSLPDTPVKNVWLATFKVNNGELAVTIRGGADLEPADRFLEIGKNYAMCVEHFGKGTWLHYTVDYPSILPSQAIIVEVP